MAEAVAAYIPCFNNARTILESINSVQRQGLPVERILVIDDCSSDNSAQLAESTGVQVIRNSRNLGRGAVRSLAIERLEAEFILSCDAAVALQDGFLDYACEIFRHDSNLASIHGRIVDGSPDRASVAGRWRERHLFRTQADVFRTNKAMHATGGALVRRSAVLDCGNYNPEFHSKEDKELGQRLLERGYDVIFDPNLAIRALEPNTVAQVLERYWRWNDDPKLPMTVEQYAKQVAYSIKVMVAQDLQAGDPLSALISIASPHYQFWRSRRSFSR